MLNTSNETYFILLYRLTDHVKYIGLGFRATGASKMIETALPICSPVRTVPSVLYHRK